MRGLFCKMGVLRSYFTSTGRASENEAAFVSHPAVVFVVIIVAFGMARFPLTQNTLKQPGRW